MTFTWTVCAVTAVVAALFSAVSAQSGFTKNLPAQAHVTGQWVVSRSDRGAVGIIAKAVACPDRLYLLSPSKITIYRFDLKLPALEVALGPDTLGTVAKSSGELYNLFVDCRANLLSVVGNRLGPNAHSFVATFDLGSRQVVRTFELPPEFSPSSAGAVHYDASMRRAFLPGVWPLKQGSWMAQPVSLALTDVTFGLILPLVTGQASKFLAGTEKGCRSGIGRCLNSFFAQSQPDEWVFAHGLGTQLYAIRSGQTIRTFDMRSPMFRYVPADSVPRNVPREEGVAWAYRNSAIQTLDMVDGHIVAAHTHHSTEKAKAGGWIDFTAYLNVFTRQGDRVHSDLRLSGLPIAASPDAVWVVSYRPERNNDATEIVLQRVSPRPAPTQGR